MSAVEALAGALARHNYGTWPNVARSILEDPEPLLEALVEAGVLERTEQALIHYRYGVNSGTVRAHNTPESIAHAVRRHEHLTMGPVGVDRIEVRTRYERVTDWRPQ